MTVLMGQVNTTAMGPVKGAGAVDQGNRVKSPRDKREKC